MFKRCPNCGFEWSSRDDFLSDPRLRVIGYQVNFQSLDAGIFLFNHKCNGTLAIPLEQFKDLYDGPIFTERATGSDDCPGFCLYEDRLEPCPARCECAYVREILQIVREWPKAMQVLQEL